MRKEDGEPKCILGRRGLSESWREACRSPLIPAGSRSQSRGFAPRAALGPVRKEKCKGGTNFTLSPRSQAKKKELVKQECGAGNSFCPKEEEEEEWCSEINSATKMLIKLLHERGKM